MSALRQKRSWSKRPRPSYSSRVPAVTSPAPGDASTGSSAETSDSKKAREVAQKDEALWKRTKSLVSEAEGLFSQNVSLSDPRIQEIRLNVEAAMPRLYELTQDSTSAHTPSTVNITRRFAEAFLKRFPDAARNGVLRSHYSPSRKSPSPSVGQRVSPNSNVHSPITSSPPHVSLPLPAAPPMQPSQAHEVVPTRRISQPIASTPLSSAPFSSLQPPLLRTPQPVLHNQSSGMQSVTIPQVIPGTAHVSPATPSPSALLQPASYPDTRPHIAPGASRPPLWVTGYEQSYTPSHLYEAAKDTTQHQKNVLFAVHDLLRKRASRLARQPWYEPPIGLSPEELVSGQEVHNDPRSHHPALAGQVQRYFPPTHPPPSPAGNPYHFHGNRSVAVGRCLPRSASME